MIRTEIVKNVPQYAACYIMYGDASGLEDSDIREIDAYTDMLRSEGMRLVSPVEGSENEFCPHPAFGLACDTQDWTAEVETKTE